MATVSLYLNFSRNTEEAFLFYKSVFGGEFSGDRIARGKVTTPLQEMFWGAYYGTCIDKFGVQRMFNCTAK